MGWRKTNSNTSLDTQHQSELSTKPLPSLHMDFTGSCKGPPQNQSEPLLRAARSALGPTFLTMAKGGWQKDHRVSATQLFPTQPSTNCSHMKSAQKALFQAGQQMGMEEQPRSDPRATVSLQPGCVLMAVRAQVARAAALAMLGAGQRQALRQGLRDLEAGTTPESLSPHP